MTKRSHQMTLNPQDVVVLLRLLKFDNEPWKQMQLALALELSQPEISNSLARSRFAGLLDDSGRQVRRLALMEFLQYGVPYAFPARPGAITRGIPTAHSGPPLNTLIQPDGDEYVWPSPHGTLRGQAITPLYGTVPKAVRFDPHLHELLALVDAIRVGRVREKNLAVEELKKRIL